MITLAHVSHYLLLLTLLLTLLGAFYSYYQVITRKKALTQTGAGKYLEPDLNYGLLHFINVLISLIYIFVSLVLLYAFYKFEFGFKYVHDYSDTTLPIFYRLTAFWGGQAGSLLFWAVSVIICGLLFQYTNSYKNLNDETKCWYLLFYFVAIAFFSFLLTTDNDPFIVLDPAPLEGRGLIPLLQHPGMIFHPPLLLLGYGGFTIPACLALAQVMSNREYGTEMPWQKCCNELLLFSWLVLSAGIILGAWWAYMELGWGGYWAWDPVENASLIPWFFATATIHLGLLNSWRKKGIRLHTLLMGLTFVSAFFATWLVRGNVVASVHAFGGGVGSTIGFYVLFTFIAVIGICLFMPKIKKPFNGPETKEGLALATSLLLITISIIIMVATLWPVISTLPAKLFDMGSTASVGLNADFYNATIMPLMTVLLAILALCPWISWTGKISNKLFLSLVVLTLIVSLSICWTFFGITKAKALMGAGISITCMVSWILYLIQTKYSKFGAVLVHVGFAMMGLGVAISGTYQMDQNLTLNRGESAQVDGYQVKLNEIYHLPAYTNAIFIISKNGKSDTLSLNYKTPITVSGYTVAVTTFVDNRRNNFGLDAEISVINPNGETENIQLIKGVPSKIADFTIELSEMKPNRISFVEAELSVFKDGEEIGTLTPQIRSYATHPDRSFSEAVTIFSFGKEIYATFSGIDMDNKARINIAIQPLVNWIWIGGIILSIAPFFTIYNIGNRRRKDELEQ